MTSAFLAEKVNTWRDREGKPLRCLVRRWVCVSRAINLYLNVTSRGRYALRLRFSRQIFSRFLDQKLRVMEIEYQGKSGIFEINATFSTRIKCGSISCKRSISKCHFWPEWPLGKSQRTTFDHRVIHVSRGFPSQRQRNQIFCHITRSVVHFGSGASRGGGGKFLMIFYKLQRPPIKHSAVWL